MQSIAQANMKLSNDTLAIILLLVVLSQSSQEITIPLISQNMQDIGILIAAVTAYVPHGSSATRRTAVNAEMNTTMQLFVIVNVENQLS